MSFHTSDLNRSERIGSDASSVPTVSECKSKFHKEMPPKGDLILIAVTAGIVGLTFIAVGAAILATAGVMAAGVALIAAGSVFVIASIIFAAIALKRDDDSDYTGPVFSLPMKLDEDLISAKDESRKAKNQTAARSNHLLDDIVAPKDRLEDGTGERGASLSTGIVCNENKYDMHSGSGEDSDSDDDNLNDDVRVEAQKRDESFYPGAAQFSILPLDSDYECEVAFI